MKILRALALILASLFSFAVGLLYFAPWHNIGAYAIDKARTSAANAGTYIYYDHLIVDGGFVPEFRISLMDIETPVASVTLEDLRIAPRAISSIFGLSPAADISYRKGKIKMLPNNELTLDDAAMSVRYGGGAVELSGVGVTGDLKMQGDIKIDIDSRKIIYSTISFAVPDSLSMIMKNPLLSRYIEQGDDGAWRFRYEGQH